ncbi:DUF2817 domain-containing protein [Thalassospira marina]|uniref:DUF2817 domain-containing protein n=1 Tax=Thalassospira marina TaxID=2048283 RepID=A0A2N3KBV6_9PROT|nr:DUF2817 domain-containing protein [Thalassospira marina]PKR48042.1 hypothetical protein COO20_25160 [Thalassospira marina]
MIRPIKPETLFSRDYLDAQSRILSVADITGAQHFAFPHVATGPGGEALATDVLWVGLRGAKNVLVIMTGTHGVELYCGSACAADLMLHGDLPAGWAMCVIHALNPWGTAWGRRENEDNIDLNRNYVDFAKPLPANALYPEIHKSLVLQELSDRAVMLSDLAIEQAEETYGARAVLTARSAGQYDYPTGLHYGGRGPSASRQILDQIITQYGLDERDQVVVWDYHTGAGPFGYCEPIYLGTPENHQHEKARAIFGSWLTAQRTNHSVTPPQSGLGSELWERRCMGRAVFVAMEFGTYPMMSSGGVLRQDNWLHCQQGAIDWQAPETRKIKTALREEYDPQSEIWRSLVLVQNRVIFDRFCAFCANDDRK